MKKTIKLLKKYYIYLVLLIFWFISMFISPFFRNTSTFSSIFITAVPIVLIGFAQNIVVIGRGFDLSVGSVAGLATCIASVLLGYNQLLAILVIITVCALIGVINGIGVTKFKIDPFIMTLATMFIINGISLIIRPSPGGFIPDSLKKVLLFESGGFALGPLLIIIITGLLGNFLLKKRSLGRMIYAIGSNPDSARMSGVNVDRIRIYIFMLSSILAGVAGIFIASRISSGNANAGASYLFDSFIVVFMGGTLVTGGVGDFTCTIAASLIIASLPSIIHFVDISSWYQYIIKGVILIIVSGMQIFFYNKRRKLNE
jgi:ribose/xylose/arabinose/galactoside ABC-type transport system permease subunit